VRKTVESVHLSRREESACSASEAMRSRPGEMDATTGTHSSQESLKQAQNVLPMFGRENEGNGWLNSSPIGVQPELRLTTKGDGLTAPPA